MDIELNIKGVDPEKMPLMVYITRGEVDDEGTVYPIINVEIGDEGGNSLNFEMDVLGDENPVKNSFSIFDSEKDGDNLYKGI